MALVVPTAASTFGDSTQTEGGRLRKYVLAQFRDDADLEWVRELRAELTKDELKWRDVKQARPRLRTKGSIWKRVEEGVARATVVVVDPEPFESAIRKNIQAEGKNLPPVDERAIVSSCATAIVGSTPIAYLPQELARAVPWVSFEELASLDSFTPQGIRNEIGGNLKNAMIFAARAHATFDLEALDDTAASTRDVLRSPLARVLLAELLATSRAFDEECPVTLTVLNHAADVIAESVGESLPTTGAISDRPLARELDSRAVDELQAADIGAGWAREILEVSEPQTLGRHFQRVWINGNLVR